MIILNSGFENGFSVALFRDERPEVRVEVALAPGNDPEVHSCDTPVQGILLLNSIRRT